MRGLRIAFIGLVASGLMAGTAMAADLVSPPPPSQVMTHDWTGLYIGIGGNGIVQSNGPELVGELAGIVGGNVQSDNFLFGAEAFLTFGASNYAYTFVSAGAEGRLGFVVNDQVLLYGSGGFESVSVPGNLYATVGAGAEFMVTDGWSLDIEAKHYIPLTTTWQGNSIGASINYHF